MKTKMIYSNYDENTGVSTVTIQTPYGIFTGYAKLHPEDSDYSSSFFGCEVAEIRACRKALKEKLKKVNYQIEAVDVCIKSAPAAIELCSYKWNLKKLKTEIKNQIAIFDNMVKLKIKERDEWNSSKYQK